MMEEEYLSESVRRLLSTEPPQMDQSRMTRFVESCLSYRELFLEIRSKHGTPLYVVDRRGLANDAARLRDAFACLPGEVEIYFAVKSNSMPEVSRILIDEGIGLDVSSGLELARAVEAGAGSIVFSGPGKRDDELSAAIANSDRITVLMDSFGELERLDRLTKSSGIRIRAGVRLSTQPTGLWRKFGIPLEDLPRFWSEAGHCPFVDLEGIQFHTSWNLTPEAHVSFIDRLGGALAGFPGRILEDIRFMDLGGGFWPEQGEWLRAGGTGPGALRNLLSPEEPDNVSKYMLDSVGIETFASEIGDSLRKALPDNVECRFYIEPGRWLCHQNMHILMEIVDVKGGDVVITDAGTNAVGWERFEYDYFPVINLSEPDLTERQCYVLGSLCTPHDVWGYSYFGRSAAPGDLLLLPLQGAYTFSLRQEFIKPVPETVVVQGPLDLSWY